MDRHERAQALAKTALAVMAERKVAPTPENYQIFFAYASGENPAVARIVGDMVSQRRPFSPDVLEDLRQRFFPASREDRAAESFGAGIQQAMTTAMSTLEAAGRDTVAYGRTLSEARSELGEEHSPEDLQKLVENLRGATRAMEERTRELEGKLQESSHEIGELKSKLDNIRKESLTDPLTGIANRKAFDTELAQAIAQARAAGEPLSLMMCDIDKFKVFNDTWGHQTGDQVLRLVAHCLSENVKGRDTAARYGGEEFAVILRQTPKDAAVTLANQIRSTVESKKLVKKSTGDILGTITVSGGVAELSAADSAASLIQRADECLYAAKDAGRNCIVSELPARTAAA
ncbi:MAG TPA: diguanylate cyclase [Rhizomicrobium sp.]|nr:diguanylate cyclase [Rhizomicrobium sp.]